MPLPGQRGFRCKKRHHTASFLKRGPPFDRKTIRRCRTRSEFQPRSPPPTPRAETRRHEHTRRNPTLRKEGRKGSDAIDASELGDPSGRPHARAGLAGASLEKKKKKTALPLQSLARTRRPRRQPPREEKGGTAHEFCQEKGKKERKCSLSHQQTVVVMETDSLSSPTLPCFYSVALTECTRERCLNSLGTRLLADSQLFFPLLVLPSFFIFLEKKERYRQPGTPTFPSNINARLKQRRKCEGWRKAATFTETELNQARGKPHKQNKNEK